MKVNNFALRLPDSLYHALKQSAEADGVTAKSTAVVPSKKACSWARVCICSSFILVTMPRIMTDTRC